MLDPVAETRYVEAQFAAAGEAALPHRIVAFAQLARADAADVLAAQAAFESVVGIRMIMSHHPTDESLVWPQVERDFLKHPEPGFSEGYALLQRHGLSFDLHANPNQLLDAAAFVKNYPEIPVVVNHLACPLFGKGTEADEAMMRTWREGVTALALLPHVTMKLSGLSYITKGWHVAGSPAHDLVSGMVREAVMLFGSDRCMFASNYPVDAFQCDNEVAPPQMLRLMREWLSELPDDDVRNVFHDTAQRFYKFPTAA